MVGRTIKVSDDQAAVVGKLLKAAGSRHPWPEEISTHWGTGGKTPIIKVQPTVVVEVAATRHYRPAATGTPCGLSGIAPTSLQADVETLPTG